MDRANDPAGLNGATFDPEPEPTAMPDIVAAEIAAEGERTAETRSAAPEEPAAGATPTRPRLPVRIVGAPVAPDAERDPSDVALRALPVAGFNRRRMAWLLGLAVSLWVVAVFARQVGDASAAADRADRVRTDNATLSAQVAALEQERDTVQERSFIQFQARAFGLGTAQEKRFTLAPNAPPLPSDAPGSASVRLAPAPTPQTPLDSWLALLFGPAR